MTLLLLGVIYLAFISLGLPDSLLGSGWPSMQVSFNVPSSYAGYVSMTISFMTILSALVCPSLLKKMHTKWIVVISIFLTILGLFGFSQSTSYWMLFVWAIPYGLGAGSIDASLNNYVALHYKSSAMNFLHCFYGVGAVISPLIMSSALKYAYWNDGYKWTAFIQISILIVCILSLPLWGKSKDNNEEENNINTSIKETIKVKGVVQTLIGFFAYCSGEATCFLWTSSYFAGTYENISDQTVAAFGSLIFGGLMLGRLISGFISNKLGDKKLIRIGIIVELIGIILVLLPIDGYIVSAIGFVVIGTGMGPIYPSIVHMAPINFDKKYSATIISLEMASAYVGSCLMPMLFGIIQQYLGIWIMPLYILFFLILNISMLEISYKTNN